MIAISGTIGVLFLGLGKAIAREPSKLTSSERRDLNADSRTTVSLKFLY